MESVRLKINEHMTSLGEEILCVLDADVCSVKLNVRVFVLERLSAAAQFMCDLFQREMGSLLLDHQNKLLDIHPNTADVLQVTVCKEEDSSEEERSSSLVQEEPEPPEEERSSRLVQEEPVKRVKIEDDDDGGENRETEPVAGTSAEHMKTQAYIKYWVQSQPTCDEQLLSSHCPESDAEDGGDDPEETRGDLAGKKSFSCTVCGIGYTHESHLKSHMRTHTGEKPFSCTVCGKAFTQTGNLNRHMRSHTGELPFSCEVCGRRFAERGKVARHMQSHTGELPFSCALCDRRFALQCRLDAHMVTHTGTMPFTCPVCGKGCTQKHNLKTHMRTHTGEKPFCCTACGKSFAHKSDLNRHVRTHAGERASVDVSHTQTHT